MTLLTLIVGAKHVTVNDQSVRVFLVGKQRNISHFGVTFLRVQTRRTLNVFPRNLLSPNVDLQFSVFFPLS